MWEFTIAISNTYKDYFTTIIKEIHFAKLEVIYVITNDNQISKLTMAIDVKNMQRLANILVECITNIILLVYKYNYFENNINLTKLDEPSKAAFLKALVMFDSVCDKEEIKQVLILNRQINLDGFYYFKLGFLRSKWGDILNIVKDSAFTLELLKFLVNNIDCNIPLINVHYKNNRFIVYDNKNKPIKLKDNIENVEARLISQLVELSPKIINLYCSKFLSNSTFKVIYFIFNKKLNLIN